MMLLALLLGATQDDARVRSLMEHLRDDSIEVRERAASELADLGTAVLPWLGDLEKSGDPELRARAPAIRRAVAQRETLKKYYRPAPPISLDFQDAPVADVLRALCRQACDEFRFEAAELTDRMTIRVAGATFWEALDRVCAAAPALTYDFEQTDLRFAKKKRPPLPSVRKDEFSVWLDGLYLTRDHDFTGPPRESFRIGLNAAWERRLAPAEVEQRLLEVVDDRGTSLLKNEPQTDYGLTASNPPGRHRRLDFANQLQVPDARARSLRIVRGYVRFSFPLEFEELEILLDSERRALPAGEGTLSVRNLRAAPGFCTFELRQSSTRTAANPTGDRVRTEDAVVIDDQGGEHKLTSLSAGSSWSSSGLVSHYQNVRVMIPADRTAVKLRFRMIREALQRKVEFEFRDLALE